MAKHGVQVELVCPELSGAPLADLENVTLKTSRRDRLRFVRITLSSVRSLLGKQRFDVLYFRGGWKLAAVGVAAKLVGVPFVVESNGIASMESRWYRNLVKQPWMELIHSWVYRNSMMVFAVTPELARFAQERYGCSPDRVAVLPNGVNTEQFRPLTRSQALFATNDRPTIGFLGNFRTWQGLEVLVRALPYLIDEFPGLLVLLGGRGERQKACEKTSAELGVDKHIQWVGVVPYEKAPHFIASCDIMVAPFVDSRRNRMTGLSPLKILNYMSCGKCFVTSDLPYLRQFKKVKGCFMCRPEDPRSLAEQCVRLLRMPAEARNELGLHGRSAAVREFDWEAIIGRMLETVAGRLRLDVHGRHCRTQSGGGKQ